MVAAVKKYFEQEHGLFISEEATTITSIPLEGEGKVEDRVDMLYANLINRASWLDTVSSADATHSQGTPVSAILIHRLLERGHIHSHRQSIGMLAMAARELFEFMDSGSDISTKYNVSLKYILQHGIKVTLVGSMQDQVVPLYSAIISTLNHPNIVRSVYIDGHAFTEENEFVIHLITFALGLRNAGLSDHGLLTHLSEVLAGSLYALEGGHSTIYEELDVYCLAIQHLFETYPLGKAVLINNNTTTTAIRTDSDRNEQENASIKATLQPFHANSIRNPYYLPWAMRGICEDKNILKNSTWMEQLDQLRRKFDTWEPSTTKLRSLKHRLEPFTLPLDSI
ncbi:hypothetical protein BC941DRAFT_463191 [Chlamydoabsidia padenii]|nr:hypothetical protein BC941DRAFT_463191 [Chlamydoabsidia padenii]